MYGEGRGGHRPAAGVRLRRHRAPELSSAVCALNFIKNVFDHAFEAWASTEPFIRIAKDINPLCVQVGLT